MAIVFHVVAGAIRHHSFVPEASTPIGFPACSTVTRSPTGRGTPGDSVSGSFRCWSNSLPRCESSETSTLMRPPEFWFTVVGNVERMASSLARSGLVAAVPRGTISANATRREWGAFDTSGTRAPFAVITSWIPYRADAPLAVMPSLLSLEGM